MSQTRLVAVLGAQVARGALGNGQVFGDHARVGEVVQAGKTHEAPRVKEEQDGRNREKRYVLTLKFMSEIIRIYKLIVDMSGDCDKSTKCDLSLKDVGPFFRPVSERAGLRKVVEQPVPEPHQLPAVEIGIAMAQDVDLLFDPVESRPCAISLSAQRLLSNAMPTPSTAAASARELRSRKGRARSGSLAPSSYHTSDPRTGARPWGASNAAPLPTEDPGPTA